MYHSHTGDKEFLEAVCPINTEESCEKYLASYTSLTLSEACSDSKL